MACDFRDGPTCKSKKSGPMPSQCQQPTHLHQIQRVSAASSSARGDTPEIPARHPFFRHDSSFAGPTRQSVSRFLSASVRHRISLSHTHTQATRRETEALRLTAKDESYTAKRITSLIFSRGDDWRHHARSSGSGAHGTSRWLEVVCLCVCVSV